MPIVLIVAALVHFFVGSLSYVRDTLLGRSQPNRMTFLIWAIGPFIGVAAGLAAGGSWALLPVFMSGFGPFLIFLASFVNPRAYWKLGLLDYICGALAVLALILWVISSDPLVAIVFAALADVLAFFPTFLKAWRYPATETGITYALAFLNVCIGILASQHHAASEMIFLSVLCIEDGLLVIAIYRHRFTRQHATA